MRTLLALAAALVLPACTGANDAVDGGEPCPSADDLYCPEDGAHNYQTQEFHAGGLRHEQCSNSGTAETLWTVDYWQDGSVRSSADWQAHTAYACWPSGTVAVRVEGEALECWSEGGGAVECDRGGPPGFIPLVETANAY